MPPPSIDEARALVLAHARALPAEAVAVADALDRVLAEDVRAAADVPGVANSAMDGFAVRSGPAGRRLVLVGESRAGAPFAGTVGDGEAARISTGAALPAGADAVLQLERCEDLGDAVLLGDDVAPGRNVRHPGEDLRAGAVVLRAGTRLGPAELALAVTAGRGELACSRRPRVALLATGDELRAPGAPLAPGQLHDSNAVALAGLARRAGAEIVGVDRVGDDAAATRERLAAALAAADLVACTGGVSVGAHDHVRPALAALGVRELTWRVALKPGGPMWIGAREPVLVLGLPGNPVSSFVCFVLFGLPALAALQGAPPPPGRARARLGVDVERTPGRDSAIRVRRDADGRVVPNGPQGSHQAHSLLGAEALALVPRGEGVLPAGSEVELESLP